MRSGEPSTERAIVRLVLDCERTLDGLERLLGPDALTAVKALASAGVVVRHGELVWASPGLAWLDDLRLIAVVSDVAPAGHEDHQHRPLRSRDA